MDLQKLKPKKPRAFITASAIPVIAIGFFLLDGHHYWQQAYEINPFRAIFGTGLFFIVTMGPVLVGKYNRKMFWIRRKRVRILDKLNRNEEK